MAVIETPISFDDLVAEGKRLVEEMNATDSRVQWRLGELADLVEPEDGEPRYGNQTVAKFAARIGRSHCTVKRYRTVFRAWKDIIKSAPGLLLPYSVAKELAGLPNRESLIEKMPAMTKRDAVELRKAYSKPKNEAEETEEMRRWFQALIKRASKDLVDEKYLDVDRDILLKVVQPQVLNTLRKGGEARIRLAAALKKICDEASLDTAA